MPGLVGLAQATGARDLETSISRAIGALRYGSGQQSEKVIDPDGRWAIGCVDLGLGDSRGMPCRHPATGTWAFFSGRLHLDPSERSAVSEEPTGRPPTDAEFLLHLYEDSGGRIPPGLRGSFSAAVVDSQRRRLVILNDTIGQRPIYYWIQNQRLLFSSTVQAILEDPAVPRHVNQAALADLMEYRYVLGEKTLIEDISLLDPGATLTYDLASGALRVEKDDSLDGWFSAPADSRNPKVVLDEVAELFNLSVQRICDPQLQNTVSLSGGMDSRAVMSVVQPERVAINSYTAGLPGSVDRRITGKIARAAHCERIYSEWGSEFLQPHNCRRLTKDAIALTDGMRGSSFHPMTMTLAEDFKKFELEIALTGHGGEFAKLDRAYGFSLDLERDLRSGHGEIKQTIFSKMSAGQWSRLDRQKLFRGNLRDSQGDALRASFDREFEKIDPSLPLEQQVSYFFLREYFRKHAVLSNRIHGNFSEIEYPFVAEDFVRAVLRTPVEMRFNHGIHRHIIQVHNPSLLRIPISDTRAPLDSGLMWKLLVTRPYALLRRYGFFETDIPEVYIPRATPNHVFDEVLLSAQCLDRGDLDPGYLSSAIERYKGGEIELFHPLNTLLAHELWCRFSLDRHDQPVDASPVGNGNQ